MLVPTIAPTIELETELTLFVVEKLGKSFSPERIVFVSDLPKTRSAKIVRRVLRAASTAAAPGDLSSLEDPDVYQIIVDSLTLRRG